MCKDHQQKALVLVVDSLAVVGNDNLAVVDNLVVVGSLEAAGSLGVVGNLVVVDNLAVVGNNHLVAADNLVVVVDNMVVVGNYHLVVANKRNMHFWPQLLTHLLSVRFCFALLILVWDHMVGLYFDPGLENFPGIDYSLELVVGYCCSALQFMKMNHILYFLLRII